MKELIKIQEREGMQAVSARELHGFLGSRKDFSNWMKDRIRKYGLVENQDYVVFAKMGENPSGGRPQTEYVLTIDCAKELAMVEGNEKGRQARRYFIERDKELRAIERGDIRPSVGERISQIESKLERLEASRITSEVHDFTVYGYAGLVRKKLYGSEAMMIGKRAAKRCKQLGLPVNQAHDFRFGWVNTYPAEVLEEVFNEFFKQPRF